MTASSDRPQAAMESGRIERDDGGFRLSGAWTLDHYARLRLQLRRLPRPTRDQAVDIDGISDLDTAGALCCWSCWGQNGCCRSLAAARG
ncbi:hypothetical protein [Marinobacterium aestuariivivens]|uniref:STAS domain-containing protein n=1 Tax=Marinobacterium aestuariivivens TaxID=1698799 RepID=A0ABW2A2B2_9GAMM